jgi:hypothetical protein
LTASTAAAWPAESSSAANNEHIDDDRVWPKADLLQSVWDSPSSGLGSRAAARGHAGAPNQRVESIRSDWLAHEKRRRPSRATVSSP